MPLMIANEKTFSPYLAIAADHTLFPMALWMAFLLFTRYRFYLLGLVVVPFCIGKFGLGGTYEGMLCLAWTLLLAYTFFGNPSLIWHRKWEESGGVGRAGLIGQFLILVLVLVGFAINFTVGAEDAFSYVLQWAALPFGSIPLVVVYILGGMFTFRGLGDFLQTDVNRAATQTPPPALAVPGSFPGIHFPCALLFGTFDLLVTVGAVFEAPVLPGGSAEQTLVISSILKLHALPMVIQILFSPLARVVPDWLMSALPIWRLRTKRSS